jgi:hypothetical protein
MKSLTHGLTAVAGTLTSSTMEIPLALAAPLGWSVLSILRDGRKEHIPQCSAFLIPPKAGDRIPRLW